MTSGIWMQQNLFTAEVTLNPESPHLMPPDADESLEGSREHTEFLSNQ